MFVMRLLRFDDPRFLCNAWTYFLGVPTGLITTSMITRSLVSGAVERSIQVGFLISILVHLGLTYVASQAVLMASPWLEPSTEEQVVDQRQASRGTQFVEIRNPNGVARPVRMKPVEAELQQPTEVKVEPTVVEQSAKLEPTQAMQEIEPELADRDFVNPRREASPSLPSVSSETLTMDRPDLKADRLPSNNLIDVPKTEVDALPTHDLSERKIVSADRKSINDNSQSLAATNRNVLQQLPDSTNKVSRAELTRRDSGSTNPSQALDQAFARAGGSLALPKPQEVGKDQSLGPRNNGQISIPLPSSSFDPGSPNQDVTADRTSTTRAVREPGGGYQSGVAMAPAIDSGVGQVFGSGLSASNSVPRKGATNGPGSNEVPSDARFADAQMPQRGARGGANSIGSASRPIDIPNGGGLGDGDAGTSMVNSDSTGNATASIDIGRESASDRMGQGAGSISSSIAMNGVESGTNVGGISSPLSGRLENRGAVPNDVSLPEIRTTDTTVDRFKRPELGGPGRIRGAVPIPLPAFKQRLRRNEDPTGQDADMLGALGPKTEDAIEAGLLFLAKYQREDGSWRLEDFGEEVEIRSSTAATALALLSFQGAGYTHEQFKHQDTCRRGLQWLQSVQTKDGDLYQKMDAKSDGNAWLYSHAIATLALCEAYGMTQDASIRDNAQAAVDFLIKSQDKNAGGWRYIPGVGSDTSVTGWCMMALKSAELAGLKVPAPTFGLIKKWLDNSEAGAREKFLYRYNWQANTPQSQHGRIPTPVMTSVGLLMRLYLGWRRDNPDMIRGSDWLLQRPPSEGTEAAPLRDTYYWYYASQVMFHMGGDRWKQWYSHLYPLLIERQQTSGEFAGSWEPNGKIPDAWGRFAGRLYVTTLNLLSLEVYYRHLPIYEATAR